MNTTTNKNILLADDTNNTNNIESVIAKVLLSGKSLLGKESILTPFVKKAVEQMLEAEMDEFLIENKITPNAKPNKRN